MIRQEEQQLHNKKTVTFHKDVKAAPSKDREPRRLRPLKQKMSDQDPVLEEKVKRFLQYLVDNPRSAIFSNEITIEGLNAFVGMAKRSIADAPNDEPLYDALVRLNNSTDQWLQRGANIIFLSGAMKLAIDWLLYEHPVDTLGDDSSGPGSHISGLTAMSYSKAAFKFSDAEIASGRHVIDTIWGRPLIKANLQAMCEREHDSDDEGSPNDEDEDREIGDSSNNIWRLKEELEVQVGDHHSRLDQEKARQFVSVLSETIYNDPNGARYFLQLISADDTDTTVASTTVSSAVEGEEIVVSLITEGDQSTSAAEGEQSTAS